MDFLIIFRTSGSGIKSLVLCAAYISMVVFNSQCFFFFFPSFSFPPPSCMRVKKTDDKGSAVKI